MKRYSERLAWFAPPNAYSGLLKQQQAAGRKLLDRVMPAMLRAQERMLAPLPKAERAKFMAMVKCIVEENNAWSRAAKEPA